jgi:hypothetical protein
LYFRDIISNNFFLFLASAPLAAGIFALVLEAK